MSGMARGLDLLIRADPARYADEQTRENRAARPRVPKQRIALQARSAIERRATRVRDESAGGCGARGGHRPVATR